MPLLLPSLLSSQLESGVLIATSFIVKAPESGKLSTAFAPPLILNGALPL